MKIIVDVPTERLARQTDEHLRASETIRLISCVICVSSLTSGAQQLPDSGLDSHGFNSLTRDVLNAVGTLRTKTRFLLLLRRLHSCLKFRENKEDETKREK